MLLQGVALAACKAMNPNCDIDTPLSIPDETSFYKPKINENERDKRYAKWKMAVERSLGWDTSTLADGNRDLFE